MIRPVAHPRGPQGRETSTTSAEQSSASRHDPRADLVIRRAKLYLLQADGAAHRALVAPTGGSSRSPTPPTGSTNLG
jgi:hypothetical protein